MASESLLKDLGEIYARLFDHHAVLQGEISFFLTEFEEKRKGREEQRLQTVSEHAQEMSEKLIPAAVTELDNNLPELHAKVATALEMCNLILEDEQREEKENWLKERRSERVEDWTEFMDNMCEASSAVDSEFEEEIKRVQTYYKDLEKKLSITATSR